MVIKRADFPMQYVDEKKFKYMYIDDGEYKGYLSQIHIIKANQPPKELGEDYIERANSGCKWLEFYPENSNVAMTVAYNHENKILNLFTVTGRLLLFQKSKLYPKYFEWYTEGVSKHEVKKIYEKLGLEFKDIVWLDDSQVEDKPKVFEKK